MVVSGYGSMNHKDCFPTFVQFDDTKIETGTMSSSSSDTSSTADEIERKLKRASQREEKMKRTINELQQANAKLVEEKDDSLHERGKRQKGHRFSNKEKVTAALSVSIRDYAGGKLFSAVKYYEGPSLREEGLDVVCRYVNITPEREVDRVKEHVMDVINAAINKSRDNKIKALKRAVWHTSDGVGKWLSCRCANSREKKMDLTTVVSQTNSGLACHLGTKTGDWLLRIFGRILRVILIHARPRKMYGRHSKRMH